METALTNYTLAIISSHTLFDTITTIVLNILPHLSIKTSTSSVVLDISFSSYQYLPNIHEWIRQKIINVFSYKKNVKCGDI